MNKLLATLIAGAFAAVSTVAIAQSAMPAPIDKSAADKAKEDQKMQKSDKAKAFAEKEKAAQDASRNSPNPADQKANVDKSKMQSTKREKVTKDEGKEIQKQQQKESKP